MECVMLLDFHLISELQEIFEAAFQSHAVLGHAVNVTPLWDVERLSRHPGISTTNLPLCQYVSERTIVELDAVRVATFFCPDLSGRNNRTGMSQSQVVRVRLDLCTSGRLVG